MKNTETRWQQRFNNYKSAFKQLDAAVQLAATRELTELEKQGLIQAFEFTHELAWKVMKDYFFFQGQSDITGSRDAIREAYQKGLIEDGEAWMGMIKSRNQTSHTYNQRIADEIVQHITQMYAACFQQFSEKMQALIKHE